MLPAATGYPTPSGEVHQKDSSPSSDGDDTVVMATKPEDKNQASMPKTAANWNFPTVQHPVDESVSTNHEAYNGNARYDGSGQQSSSSMSQPSSPSMPSPSTPSGFGGQSTPTLGSARPSTRGHRRRASVVIQQSQDRRSIFDNGIVQSNPAAPDALPTMASGSSISIRELSDELLSSSPPSELEGVFKSEPPPTSPASAVGSGWDVNTPSTITPPKSAGSDEVLDIDLMMAENNDSHAKSLDELEHTKQRLALQRIKSRHRPTLSVIVEYPTEVALEAASSIESILPPAGLPQEPVRSSRADQAKPGGRPREEYSDVDRGC